MLYKGVNESRPYKLNEKKLNSKSE